MCTPGRRQSKTLSTIDERASKIDRNSVFDCDLSPAWRQMAIENTVSFDFLSTFLDSIGVFDCRLPGVMYVSSPSKPLSQSQEYFPSSWLIQIPFTQGDDSQACCSISHLLPVKPSLHTQVKKESELWKQRNVSIFIQGSYMQVCVKFKDFSRTSKRLYYCFQRLKTYEKY